MSPSKELGELKHFLGLEVEHTKKGIILGQQNYAKDLLQGYGQLYCKPISTPVDPNVGIQEDKLRKRLGGCHYVSIAYWESHISHIDPA